MSKFVITPEKKKAGDSLSEYIKYFTRIVTTNGWDDAEAARIFAGMLGVGENDLEELDAATLASFDAIKAALLPKDEFFREAEVRNFFSMYKQATEPVEEFYRRCKKMVSVCYQKFAKANKDQLTRDRFVHGLPNGLKMAVLNQKNTKSEEAVEAAILAETIRTSFTERQSLVDMPSRMVQAKKSTPVGAKTDIICYKCGAKGHIAKFCPPISKGPFKIAATRSTAQKNVNVSSMEVSKINRPMVDAVVNGLKLKLLVDTGSCVSVLPSCKFAAKNATKSQFRTATDMPIEMEGTLSCDVMLDNWEFEHEFYVGNVNEPVLGIDFMKSHSIVIDTSTGKLMVKGHNIAHMYQAAVSNEEEVFMISAIVPSDNKHSKSVKMIYPEELVPELSSSKSDIGREQQNTDISGLKFKFREVFNGLGCTDIVCHQILTGDATPINVPSHRLPVHLMDKARIQINQMVSDGIIKKSRSPWCNPVVLVPKKSGDIRVAIDFRKLNAVCKKDAYPMPRIDECIERLQGAKVYSLLDCNSGYYQICVAPDDQEKTAFRFQGELWEFTRMPFGLSAAPASFCRLMTVLFANEPNVVTYLDDICIFSKSTEEHVKHLERALSRLQDAGLTLNEDKCKFFQEDIKFLGFEIRGTEIRPSKEKWKAMTDFPRPTNALETKRFLGLVGYYRTMIPQFAVIAAPLYDLTSPKRKFSWELRHENGFKEIKESLMRDVVRLMPNPSQSFIVRTDASIQGIGALLLQEEPNGERFIIECLSKKFSETERRYSVVEQEAYAVMYALDKWEHFLLGKNFLLETDHKPLVWLQSKKDCRGKLGRWALRLSSFDFTIKHIPGKMNVDADVLSRTAICSISSTAEELQQEQKEDTNLAVMLQKESTNFKEVDGLLYHLKGDKLQLCLPRSRIKQVWTELHDKLGHGGPTRILDMARERFYWPKMRNDIKLWAKQCHLCNVNKDFLPQLPKAPMIKVDHSKLNPMERISIDVMGPFPVDEGGNRYLLVMEDCFTKWTEAKPVKEISSRCIINWLREEVFSRYSLPREIVLDRGSNMESSEFKSFCDELGISLKFTTIYHHQSNPVERLNRSLLNIIRILVSDHQKEWSTVIPIVLLSYRVSKHESIKVSPFEAMFGVQPRLPVDLAYATQLESVDGMTELIERLMGVHRKMRGTLQNSAKKSASAYDKHHRVKDPQLAEGDLVYLRKNQYERGTAKKLSSLWTGPYELLKKVSEVNWLIGGSSNTTRLVHVNLLKRCGEHRDSVVLGELRQRGRPRKIRPPSGGGDVV